MSEENWWPSKEEYDPKITKEKWLELLKDEKIFNFNSKCMMHRFLDIGGEATCVELAEKYGKTDSSYNMASTQLARRILKKERKIKQPPENLFPVLYLGRRVSKEDTHKGVYIWKLRDELKSALEEMDLSKYPLKETYSDWKKLLSEYKKLLKKEETRKVAFDDEIYKWETITKCKNYSGLQILSYIIDENLNLVDAYARGESKKLLNDSRFENVYKNLINESKGLSLRLQDFKEAISAFYNDSEKNRILKDEHSASLFLTCNNPQKYTFYKASYYESLCKYLHIDSELAGEKYEHYLSLIDEFVPLLEADSEIMDFYNEHTKNFEKSSKLIAQNIIYVLFENGKKLVKLAEGDSEMSKAEELVKLLEHTHNLILHGAPGTGKTHLASDIAKAMGAEVGFVQFHPSYDYTDFVEGLRPVNDGNSSQIGFERKDGVFKKFCERALQNINGFSEDNFDEAYQKLVDKVEEAEESESPYILKTLSHKKDFALKTNSLQNFYAVPQTETKTHMPITKNSIRTYLRTGEISDWKPYLTAIAQHLIDDFGYKKIDATENNKPFIFIIDEINRGEMSKIFGELFYAIEPSYRGSEKCRDLRTQYANLQTVPNPFDSALDIKDSDNFGHFFIPENVYIIGTMNDIDRNVESMDFAFRRRFTFVEVKAEENLGMLSEIKDDSTREMSRKKMTALNNAISNIEGLSSAYHIGGAYFLKLNNFEGTTEEKFAQLWKYHLEGLLREYLRGMEDVETNIKKLEEAYNLKNVADSSKEVIENS